MKVKKSRITSYLNNLKRNLFLRSLLIIFTGIAIAQGLTIVASPLISRLYTPYQLGLLALFSSILDIITISVSLHYHKAIPIAEDDDGAAALLLISGIILLFITFITLLAIHFFGDFFLRLFNAEELKEYVYYIPIGIFLIGLYIILSGWHVRKKNYKSISQTRIMQGITNTGLKLSFGFFNFGTIGLIIAKVFSGGGGILLYYYTIKREKKLIFNNVTTKRIKYNMKRYVKFPLYSFPAELTYSLGNNLPIIFLTILFGLTLSGYYSWAYSLVRLPIALFGESLAQVFYAEVANIGKDKPQIIKRMATGIIKKLFLIGIIPVILFAMFAPQLFSFVFGDIWYEAGIYAGILSILAFANLIIAPIGRLLEVFERQGIGLFLNIFRLFLVVVIFTGAKFLALGSTATILLYTIFMIFVYLLSLVVVYKIIDDKINE